MRLAVMYQDGTANSYYRAVLPLLELQRKGHAVTWPNDPGFAAGLAASRPPWDLVHVHQQLAPHQIEVVEHLHRCGVAIVWDNDDDISEVPWNSPTYRRLGGWVRGRRRLRALFDQSVRMAELADAMTTPSEHLAQTYRHAGIEHVIVVENCIAREDADRRRSKHAGIVIGWTAATEHEADLRQLRIAKTLRSLMDAYPAVRVVTIGVDLKLGDRRYINRRVVPIEQLLDRVAEFDIGMAPLCDTPFNRSRSNIKLKEYAAAGAAWLASPVGPYAGMGEAEGGELVPDADWPRALAELVEDAGRRTELARNGRAWVRGETARDVVGRWEAVFREAVRRSRARRRELQRA